MVRKGLSVVIVGCISVLLYGNWSSLMHNLARVYEHLFILAHYDYQGIEDCYKKLSWGEKIVCKAPYATKEVVAFLQEIETSGVKEVLWSHRGKLTEKAEVGEYSFVVKSAALEGAFRNLLYMGRGVNVWNNAHWADAMGLPVLKPVAFVEKREVAKTKSFIVYLYEGRVCEKALKEGGTFFPKVQEMEKLLLSKGIIHHDFRLRNMVILEDGTLQFIDIDKLHWYPYRSHVFYERMKREVRKFNTNMQDHAISQETLAV